MRRPALNGALVHEDGVVSPLLNLGSRGSDLWILLLSLVLSRCCSLCALEVRFSELVIPVAAWSLVTVVVWASVALWQVGAVDFVFVHTVGRTIKP